MIPNNFTLKFLLNDIVDYLSEKLAIIEDPEFYHFIVSKLIDSILDDEELRGDCTSSFKELIEYFKSYGIQGSDEVISRLCTDLLDLMIGNIIEHIAIDHPMFSKDYVITYTIDRLVLYVTFNKKET